MADATKYDSGKSRHDLLPWHEFTENPRDIPVDEMAELLRFWWVGAPHPLQTAIPTRQLHGIATVLGFGAAKYAPRGWESGITFSRVFAAASRHAAALERGELLDPESGLPHQHHFWCNVLFLVVFTERGRTDLDDRPTAVASVVARLDATRAQIDSLRTSFGMDEPAPPTPRNTGSEN